MPLKISHSAAGGAGRRWRKPLCLRISESTMEAENNMLSDRGRDGRTRVSIGSMEETLTLSTVRGQAAAGILAEYSLASWAT
jgi:hypothetical protein